MTADELVRAELAERDGLSPLDAAMLAGVSRTTIMIAYRAGDLKSCGSDASHPQFAPEVVRAWARSKKLIA